MRNLKRSLFALIAVLTLYGIEARAESFDIPDVQGAVFISTSRDGGPPTLKLGPIYQLGGPGLTVFTQSVPSGDPGSVEARDTCMTVVPCLPGMVIGTNSSFSGLISSQFFTSARVNGVLYDMVRVTGSLNFFSEPIVLPSFASSSIVTIPFTFSGELTGNAFSPGVVNPVFTATLSGEGETSFHFTTVGFDFSNLSYKLDFIEYRFEPVLILIDIKPATLPNSINPKSNGKIPVAILTTPSFDATAVDPATILFGATGLEAGPVRSALEDVDGDGDLDMVLHFATQDTGITCGDTTASLTGTIFNGPRVKGTNLIETVGCK